MAKKNKHKPAPQPGALSPKSYLRQGNARKLPIVECWINGDWQEQGFASIVVARQHKNGNYTYGSYYVDMLCLGLKQTSYFVNEIPMEYQELVDGHLFQLQEKMAVDYVLVHNLIYGSIAYAEDLGFKPDKDWGFSQLVLEEDDDRIELLELEFGRGGKPYFIPGPYDNVGQILLQLEKSVGRSNFVFDTGYNPFKNFMGLDDDDTEEDSPINEEKFDDYEDVS